MANRKLTRSEAGRKGGKTTLKKYGTEFYSRQIGQKRRAQRWSDHEEAVRHEISIKRSAEKAASSRARNHYQTIELRAFPRLLPML